MAEWEKKKESYPWLTSNALGHLLCKVCMSVSNLKSKQSHASNDEWTKKGISWSGSDIGKQKSSLRRKIFDHKSTASHVNAQKILEEAKKDQLPEAFLSQYHKDVETTTRLLRTAYSVAKHNRPYVSYGECIELQEANGVHLGTCQHSRFAATGMIECVSAEMRRKLCHEIVERKLKISVMLDESTTVSRKSCMVVFLFTPWPMDEKCDECFSFPLGLVELESLKADHIVSSLLELLKKNGFENSYLEQNLIGACSDGASVMLGKNSGALTQLQNMFPKIVLWHCMCHRIELAIGDAVKSVGQVNHVKSFLDKLYSVFSQSPKAQRELEESASQVHSELLRIGRVLDFRWAASSYRSLCAVWKSYPALYHHCMYSDSSKQSKHKSTYTGMANVLKSPQFVHSLAVLLDALESISKLSLALQSETCSLGEAYSKVKRAIRCLELQKEGELGEYYKEYEDCEGSFKGVELSDGRNQYLNKSAFLQALIDNLNARLHNNVGIDNKEFQDLLQEADVLDHKKWPSGITSPWIEGERKLKTLCKRFSLDFSTLSDEFQDFVDSPSIVPASMKMVKGIIQTLPVSSADYERGFSSMNAICTDLRNSLTVEHINSLMFISLVGPPVKQFKPEPYVKAWLKSHRSAEFFKNKKAETDKQQERYHPLWEVL